MIACLMLPNVVDHVVGQNPEFSGHPIIVINPSGKIRAVSHDLAEHGIRVGMKTREAHALYPNSAIVSFTPAPYKEFVGAVEESLHEFTSGIELVRGFWHNTEKPSGVVVHPSAAIWYLDLGKLSRADGIEVADRIHKLLTEAHSVIPHIGLASSKFPASVAVRSAKAQKPTLIPRGEERQYISSEPVTLLPLTKGMQKRLKSLGIETLGDFAALPADEIVLQFGKGTDTLHERARGIDTRPVVPRAPKPKEQFMQVFEGAIEDRLQLETILHMMGCEVEERLRTKNLTLRTVTLALLLDDGTTVKSKRTLRAPTANGELVGRTLIQLFSQLQLLVGVVEIHVTVLDLGTPFVKQLDLFDTPAPVDNKLSELLEHLVPKFGNDSFYHPVMVAPNHPIPEYRFLFEQMELS